MEATMTEKKKRTKGKKPPPVYPYHPNDRKTKLRTILDSYQFIKLNSIADAASMNRKTFYNIVSRYGLTDYNKAKTISEALGLFGIQVGVEDIVDE